MAGEVMSISEHLTVIFVVPDQEPPPVVEVTADIIKAELSDYISDTFVWKVREISNDLCSGLFHHGAPPHVHSHVLAWRADDAPLSPYHGHRQGILPRL